ncbi:hypothetical protein AVEN_228268-1 [Araneus ventricosus]|uniref:Uncharacterized protein n=1 Tax=Araneus ventricosus TaxID=182803 RepID=A0A4Y2PKF9_ARAVE|nr:hypothetical protein AVEN_228268-1 [Araneus ventricosus]
MFSIEDCIIQLATAVSTPGSRSIALSTTNCEEKKGECGRVHFTNPYVNKTSVYKGKEFGKLFLSRKEDDRFPFERADPDLRTNVTDESSCAVGTAIQPE